MSDEARCWRLEMEQSLGKLKQGDPPPGWAMIATHVDDVPGVSTLLQHTSLKVAVINTRRLERVLALWAHKIAFDDASELTPLKGRKPNGDFMTKGSEEYSPLHCKLLAMALLEDSDVKGGGEQGDSNEMSTGNVSVSTGNEILELVRRPQAHDNLDAGNFGYLREADIGILIHVIALDAPSRFKLLEVALSTVVHQPAEVLGHRG